MDTKMDAAQTIKVLLDKEAKELKFSPQERERQEKLIHELVSSKDKLPYQVLKLPEKDLEQMYQQGKGFYDTGNYKKAKATFYTLSVLNPSEFNYVFSFAATLHVLKEYRLAKSFYLGATLIDPANPMPYYHLYDCYMQLNDTFMAALHLNAVIQATKGKDAFKELKKRAELELETLNPKFLEDLRKTLPITLDESKK